MDILQWSEYFETGLPEIDIQHRHLVDVANKFGRQLSLDQVKDVDIEQLYTELISYTQYHFEEEEQLMGRLGVGNRHLSAHKENHKEFLDDVVLLKQLSVENKAGLADLFEFLTNWLVYHILGTDLNMARRVRAAENGDCPDSVCDERERDIDYAAEMLLSSLNKLFGQVSRRNKELAELNRTLEDRVAERTEELSEVNRKLGELALTDSLTGLPNRRQAMQVLGELWDESMTLGTPMACLMIDADGFKEINDNYGHDAGDLILCELARHLQYAVRTDDLVCRLGGDEFLIISPNTGKLGAEQIAAATHKKINELKVPVVGGAWVGSISVGVGVKTDAMKKPGELLKAADNNVYAAKRAGKNCVVSA